jgi:galactonate dehydratase
MVETPATLDRAVADLKKTRERIGPDGLLMFDGHGKFTATAAIQLCGRIEPLGLLYFEEVVPPENNADLLRVKRATKVPLAVGERMGTFFSLREPLTAGACDVINPDVVSIGGISQLHKAAVVAELFDVAVAPHSTHSAIGLAATLHVDAAVNNFLVQEAYEHIVSGVAYVAGPTWTADKLHLRLPSGPGLGVKVDLDALRAAAAKHRPRGIRKAYFLPDGSVADR